MAKILLVEDEPTVVDSLVRYLEDRHSVAVAGRLADAVPAAKDSDLVLLNLNLPDSCGLGTFTAIREVTASPIIVLMRVLTGSDAGVAVLSGAHDFLLKGALDQQTLLRAVTRALDRKPLNPTLSGERMSPVVVGLSGIHQEMRQIRQLAEQAVQSHQIAAEHLAKELNTDAASATAVNPACRYTPRRDCAGERPARARLHPRRGYLPQVLSRAVG